MKICTSRLGVKRMSTLIVYASKYGFTEKCAHLLADQLTDQIEFLYLNHGSAKNLKNYDTIVIGSPIYMGKIRKEAAVFCNEHLEILKNKRLGLFICGMQEENAILDDLWNSFPTELIKKAAISAHFGGEYNFEKLKGLDRFIVKKIAKTSSSVSNIKEGTITEFAKKLNTDE